MKEVSPLIFGPGTWIIMHIFALVCDSEENRKYFLHFIERVLKRLPCKSCRKHALEYYNQKPPDQSSELFRWTWEFHNSVNERLNKQAISYEDAKKMYENSEVILSENGEECSECDDSVDSNKEINIKVI